MRKHILQITFLVLLLTLSLSGSAQRIPNKLVLDGTVLGYTYNNTTAIFRKKKIEIEGSLSGAQVELIKGGEVIDEKSTNSGGEFQMVMDIGATYLLTYSKKGYGTSSFQIVLKDINPKIAQKGLILRNIEMILNNYESKMPQDNGRSFGKLIFNNNRNIFEFRPTDFEKKERLFKKDEENTAFNLMFISLEKNEENNIPDLLTTEETSSDNKRRRGGGSNVTDELEGADSTFVMDNIESPVEALKKIISFKKFRDLTSDDLSLRGAEIEKAWNQLEKAREMAVTENDFMLIELQEEFLLSAQRELENAEAYIAEQEDKINAQQNFLYATYGVIFLLILIAIGLWFAYRERKKANLLLAEKNKKITDSIRYADKIQRSVLYTEAEIKTLLPQSFVLYKPLDVVSGDFYWFSKIDNKVIIAAVDCTGHGVPGAFMSLIGNTLLNQIVNEEKNTDPAAILEELHDGIVDALRQTTDPESAQDGMDLALCCIDTATNELVFSGAMNPLYLVRKDQVSVLNGNLRGIGGIIRKKYKRPFVNQKVEVRKGDRVYLFSDGYMDQFGGEKDEKFNVSRFQQLILDVQSQPMENQKDQLLSVLNDWKKDTRQVDDILVIGAEV